MGYMGFGMRKEVFKRKPKEIFKKLKEVYGNDTPNIKHNPNTPSLSTEEVLNKSRSKSIRETKAYQFMKIGFLLLTLGILVNIIVVQPLLFKWELESYKHDLIDSFSNEHDFILNSGNHLSGLTSFVIDSLDKAFIVIAKEMEYKGPFYHSGENVVKIGTWDSNALEAKIGESEIIVVREDSTQKLRDEWLLIFEGDLNNPTYDQILTYLNTNGNYIDSLRSKLRSAKISEVMFRDPNTTVEIAASRKYGTYEFLRTSKDYKESKNLIKFDSMTYLVRKY